MHVSESVMRGEGLYTRLERALSIIGKAPLLQGAGALEQCAESLKGLGLDTPELSLDNSHYVLGEIKALFDRIREPELRAKAVRCVERAVGARIRHAGSLSDEPHPLSKMMGFGILGNGVVRLSPPDVVNAIETAKQVNQLCLERGDRNTAVTDRVIEWLEQQTCDSNLFKSGGTMTFRASMGLNGLTDYAQQQRMIARGERLAYPEELVLAHAVFYLETGERLIKGQVRTSAAGVVFRDNGYGLEILECDENNAQSCIDCSSCRRD